MLLKSQIFNNFSLKLILFSSISCLILSFIVSEFVHNILIFSGILSFGIIHGANDLLLLKKKLNKTTHSLFSLLVPYLMMILFFGIFFYLFPSFALIFFVLFSSYHFGEQQWTMFANKNEKKLVSFYFSYGFFLFSLLFWFNSVFVNQIILDITGINIEFMIFNYFLYFSSVLLIFHGFLNLKFILNQIVIQLLLLILLLIIFYNVNLIMAFGIYFVFWHSIPSIIEQSEFIYGSSDLKSFKNYFKNAVIYWIISLFGLLILYYFLKDYQNLLVSIFFSFLAAITFPHTLVIFKMKRN